MPHLRRTAVLAVATACVASLLAMGATASAATVAAGEAQSCAVFTGGTLKCWGSNSFGSLGIGSTSSTPTAVPTQVVGLTSGVTDVRLAFSGGGSAGVGCAVVNGGARCWGRNGGNIGNGTSGGGVIAPVTPVGLDAGVTQVSVSASDSAALQNGVIKGFGGSSGKFAKQSLVPVAVGPPGGVAEIAEGWRHACYLLQTGGVACVGDNTNGQLGASGPGTASAVAGLPGPASRVAAGGDVSCAIVNGGVHCWGSDAFGQLGRGAPVSRGSSVPAPVAGLTTGVTDISASKNHTCVIKDGAAFCWGANASGQLGDGTTNPAGSATPVQVKGLTGVTSIAVGRDHTCAVASGGVWCWGSNRDLQLGLASAGSGSPVPVLVDGVPTASIATTPLTIPARRQATLGTVACPASYGCRLVVPRVTARIGGKAYVLTILGRRSLGVGQKETLKVSLPQKAFDALKGRSTQVRFTLGVVVAGQETPVAVKRTLRAR